LVKDNIQFHSWISDVLVGTVEHTRNGYDRLIQYEKKFGSFFSSYSIAVSNKKVNEESKEVARSVINAVESILYGQGLTLSGRKIMVFGAGGNIGRFLCEKLPRDKTRIHEKNLIKIDLKYTGDGKYEYRTINDVPEKLFLGVDLFIGLTGKSILTTPHIERLLLRGRSTNLFFASGSTKTLEYTHLIEYLKKLSFSKKPTVGGFPIIVRFDRIIDPQTGLDQGGRATLEIFNSNKPILRTLYLLGDLSPINFLYYGVPAESMDSIISQLIRLSLGIVSRYRKKILPERGIYAVDREVDEWARPISAPDGI